MRFYDRERERDLLRNLKGDFRVAVIGRRRIGKTRLVEHHYGKDCLTLFVPAEKVEREVVASWTREYPDLQIPPVTTIAAVLDHLFQHHKEMVVFIDEIQNLLKVSPSALSDLQRQIDKYRPRLVVSGSLISMTKKVVVDHRSPLYGRFDYIIRLRELDLPTVHGICKDLGVGTEDAFRLYSVFGGVPKYYELLEKVGKFSFEDYILDSFIRYPRPLYDDVRTMLKEEFGKEYVTFFSILSAVSQGHTRSSEIAGSLGRKETGMTKYLNMLRHEFELIDRSVPVTGGKRGVYSIRDNLIAFWFMNVWRHHERLETGHETQVAEVVREGLNIYVSRTFERTIRTIVADGRIPLPFMPTDIGKEWGSIPGAPKGSNVFEIDMVALDRKGKKRDILFAECKWQDGVDAGKVLDLLRKKASFVAWNAGKRTEHYMVIARGFKRKVEEDRVHLYDMDDLGGMFATTFADKRSGRGTMVGR